MPQSAMLASPSTQLRAENAQIKGYWGRELAILQPTTFRPPPPNTRCSVGVPAFLSVPGPFSCVPHTPLPHTQAQFPSLPTMVRKQPVRRWPGKRKDGGDCLTCLKQVNVFCHNHKRAPTVPDAAVATETTTKTAWDPMRLAFHLFVCLILTTFVVFPPFEAFFLTVVLLVMGSYVYMIILPKQSAEEWNSNMPAQAVRWPGKRKDGADCLACLKQDINIFCRQHRVKPAASVPAPTVPAAAVETTTTPMWTTASTAWTVFFVLAALNLLPVSLLTAVGIWLACTLVGPYPGDATGVCEKLNWFLTFLVVMAVPGLLVFLLFGFMVLMTYSPQDYVIALFGLSYVISK